MEIDEKQVFSLIQKSKETGKIRIGVNEVTKAVERGQAKFVVNATDVSPAEIVAHLSGLCLEMKSGYAQVGNKAELGAAVGIKNTSAIAVLDAGSAKKELDELMKSMTQAPKTEAKAEVKVEETKEEAPVKEEEAVEETSQEEKPKEE